jgi:hypothetical protein
MLSPGVFPAYLQIPCPDRWTVRPLLATRPLVNGDGSSSGPRVTAA